MAKAKKENNKQPKATNSFSSCQNCKHAGIVFQIGSKLHHYCDLLVMAEMEKSREEMNSKNSLVPFLHTCDKFEFGE